MSNVEYLQVRRRAVLAMFKVVRHADTSREARAAHLELLRNATNAQRFARVRSLSNSVIALSRRAIRRRHPDWSEDDVKLEWVRLNYGEELAAKLRLHLEQRRAT